MRAANLRWNAQSDAVCSKKKNFIIIMHIYIFLYSILGSQRVMPNEDAITQLLRSWFKRNSYFGGFLQWYYFRPIQADIVSLCVFWYYDWRNIIIVINKDYDHETKNIVKLIFWLIWNNDLEYLSRSWWVIYEM